METAINSDIELSVRLRLNELNTDIAALKKMIRLGGAGEFNTRQLAELQASARNYSQQLSKIGKDTFSQLGIDKVMPIMKKTSAEFKSMDDVLGGLDKQMKKNSVVFAGYALSIMFFGQQLQKMFMGLAKASLATFNDISHSVEGNTTRMDLLNAEWTYLKYTIGEALDPIVSWLAPIIDALSDWVSRHEELTAGIVATGVVLGGLLATGGALKLAIDGFKQLGVLTGALNIDKFGKVSMDAGFVAFLTNPVVLSIATALIALAAVSWKAFSETPEAWKAIKDSVASLKEPLSQVMGIMGDLIKDTFGVTVNWQTVAWTIAWAVDVGVKSLKVLLAAIKDVLDQAAILANLFRSIGFLQKALFFSTNAEDRINNLKDAASAFSSAMNGLKKNYTGSVMDDYATASSEFYKTLAAGPESFKQEALTKQFSERYNAIDVRVYLERPIGAIEGLSGVGYNNADIINMLSRQIVAEIKRNE